MTHAQLTSFEEVYNFFPVENLIPNLSEFLITVCIRFKLFPGAEIVCMLIENKGKKEEVIKQTIRSVWKTKL